MKNLLEKLKFITEKLKYITKKFILSSIKTKLIIGFMVIVIPIVILGIVSYSESSNATMKLAKESSISNLMGVNGYLDSILKNLEAQAGRLANSEDTQNYINKNYEYENVSLMNMINIRRNIENNFKSFALSNENVSNFFLVAQGDRSLNANLEKLYIGNMTLDTIKDTPTYKLGQKANGKTAWIGYHDELDKELSIDKKKYAMSAVKIIKNLDTLEDMGMLVFDVNNEYINNILSEIDFGVGKGYEVHLITNDGRDLSPQIAGKKANNKNTSFVKHDIYKKISKMKEKKGSIDVSYNGKEYIMTFTKIDYAQLTLVGMIPKVLLEKSSNGIFVVTFVFVILAIIFAVVIGVYISTGMSKSINKIIYSANTASSGNLTEHPVSDRNDEFGILTESISSMISNMRMLIKHTANTSKIVTDSVSNVFITSQKVSSVSNEISAAINEISQGAFTQAADAEQCVTVMNSLVNKINEVSVSATSIGDLTKNTMEHTYEGLMAIKNLDQKSVETTKIIKEIVDNIKTLNANSNSIGKVTKVISDMSKQIKLLSLNAAIEAAKSGDAGKGFSVIATEIKKLAQKSMVSVKEISTTIIDIQNQTIKAVENAINTEAILKTQNQALLEVITIFKEINISMDNLFSRVDQIMSVIEEMVKNKELTLSAIESISAVSQEIASSSQEVTASTTEQLTSIKSLEDYAGMLDSSSKNLLQSISQFKVN